MLDKSLAAISIVLFLGFMGIVIYFVKELDLTIIVVAVLMMAIYDFWRATRNNDKKNAGED